MIERMHPVERKEDAAAPDYRARGPAALAHALAFTAEDLAANRRGALTERQVQRVHQHTAVSVVRMAAVCLPLFLILVLLFNDPTIGAMLWVVLLTGTPFVLVALRLWPAIKDANAMRVYMVTGQVHPERWQPAFWRRGGWFFRLRPGYYLRMVGIRFRVSREVFLAFEDGPYTLYYTPNAHLVVSAEALPQPDEVDISASP